MREFSGAVAPAMAAHADQRLEYRVGKAQLLLSELLVLPASGLEERVAVELDANGALELAPERTCSYCGRRVWGRACVPCQEGRGRDRERVEMTGRAEGLERLAARTVSREVLLADAARGLVPAERVLAGHLLAEVDDLGLLPDPVSVVAARLGVPPDVVRRVIAVLRAAGAPGVCAADLEERLRLQVDALAEVADVPPEVHALLDAGLGDVLTDGAGNARKACGARAGAVRAALSWIRSHVQAELFPHDDAVIPVVVDIVVRQVGGRLVLDLVPGPWSALRVAESYAAATGDPLIDRDVARARRFIEGLSRRASTMLRVGEAAVARQSVRVVDGPGAHVPLCRRDVAGELGLHESTVSRAVAGKHLLLPSGETIAFSALFGAARGVQHCLRQLVAAESTALSDAELASALAARGHRVARRTVAKYRGALGIPAQHRR